MDEVRLSKESWGATIVLARPPVNALSTPLLQRLATGLTELIDARPNLVVITGDGGCFSAGADIKERYTRPEDIWTRLQSGQRVLDLLRAAPFPTLAAVDGYCLGGAMNIIANCDLRVASDAATFGNPEIKVGRAGGTACLRGLLPEGMIRWLALTGETIDAATAERLGFVQKVFPAASWPADLDALAERISGYGGSGLYTIKEGLQRTQSMSARDGQWTEQQLTYRLFLEGARAQLPAEGPAA